MAGVINIVYREDLEQGLNIDAGVIQNPNILSFQKRQPQYPHALVDPEAN